MHDATVPRSLAIAGLVSIALGVAAALVDRMWSFPATTASPAEIAAFVTGRRAALAVAMVLNTTAVSLWLAFVAGVWSSLRQADADRHPAALAIFGWATTAFVTLLLAGFTAFWLLLARPPAAASAGLLYDLTFGLLAMSGVPTALALGAYAMLATRARILGRATVHLAVVAAVAHVGLLASFIVQRGFFSLEGPVILAIPGTLFAWIVATAASALRTA